jgi:hypothetical protein
MSLNNDYKYAYNKINNTLNRKTPKYEKDMKKRAKKYSSNYSKVHIITNDTPYDNKHLNYDIINDPNKLNRLLKQNEDLIKEDAKRIISLKKQLKDTHKNNFSRKIRNGITNLENKLNSIKSILNLTRKNKKKLSPKNSYAI